MSGEPKTLTPPWAYYRRTGLSEMRPYVPGEDLTGISVSDPDKDLLAAAAESGENPGGYIARNPENHADQWYVAQAYFDANLEPMGVPVVARDEAAELRAENAQLKAENERLRAAIREWAESDLEGARAVGLNFRGTPRHGAAKDVLHSIASEGQ